VVLSNIAFKEIGDYLPVDAGTYDLEVRLARTNDVALEVPGLALAEGTVYTVFAMGLAGGEPTLTAVPSADMQPMASMLPETGSPATALNIALVSAALGSLLTIAGASLKLKAARVKS
jgi:hypothetical protein